MNEGKDGFKDRSLGLLVCGIVEILIGGFLILLVPLSIAAVALTPAAAMSQQAGLRSAIPAAVVYLVLAAVFIILGVGSIRARRWARDLMLSLSWIWLVTGFLSLVLTMFLLPSMLREMDSSLTLTSGVVLVVTMVIAAVIGFLYVVLPGAFVLFYRSPHVAATCRARDDRPQWTDDCPPHILSLAVCWALAAVSVLVTPAYRFVMPLFGILVDGALGAVLYALTFLVCAGLAWGTCRRQAWAWWGAVVVTVVGAASTMLTFARVDILEFYRSIDLPPEQIDVLSVFAAPGRGAIALFWAAVWGSILAYLFSVRKFFRARV